MTSMRNEKAVREGGKLARTVRDVAGIVGLIGVGILGGFALLNLRPGWEWTQEDEERQVQNETDGER